MNNRKQQNVTKALFIIYLIVLTWIILFKMQIHITEIFQARYRNVNLVPFQGSLATNKMTAFKEIIMNVIIFVPYGVYISMLKENWNILKKTAPIFLTSLAYELLQYILSIGASDITDLIGNTLGGISGVVLFWLLSKVLKDNTIKVINILALIGTVFMAGLLGMLVIANL